DEFILYRCKYSRCEAECEGERSVKFDDFISFRSFHLKFLAHSAQLPLIPFICYPHSTNLRLSKELNMYLQQKNILITAGASGLGAACVRLLTQTGAQVAILDLNAEAGEALAAEIGNTTRFIKTNVSDETDVQNAIKNTIDAFGTIHGAINCAGIAPVEKVI